MADSMMSKAATMEIPINSNGDTRTLAEDDTLEQVSEMYSRWPVFLFFFKDWLSFSLRFSAIT